MGYARPPGASQADFMNARLFEEEVGSWLGDFKIGSLDSSTKMDWWVPGFYLDVKEKRQQLGERFAKLWPEVPREHLFVIDELSVRRAMQYGYSGYFLIRDCPMDRLYLVRVDELTSTERVRANRETTPGRKKGKWLVDLRAFRQIEPGPGLLAHVLQDQIDTPWKNSELLGEMDHGNV